MTPTSSTRIAGVVLVVLLSLLAVWRSAIGTAQDGFSIDEAWHIVAGTSYVREGDRHLNPEHPPLAKLWVGAAMPETFRLGKEPALREKQQERPPQQKARLEKRPSVLAMLKAPLDPSKAKKAPVKSAEREM